ncbi:MAG: ribosome small subunit-dependent GTPase A [Bacilli bacterium]|nr:ribosome small subunit-dependent GTPase A [Bacilli bacterium]
MEINKGLVIRLIAGEYKVYDLNTKQIINAKPRGVMRIKSSAPKVGDYVDYTLIGEDSGIIEKINERHNDLIRPYISNIDQAFVIFSVKEPDLNLNLLDKFLVTLEFNNITPIIVFNKWDLLNEKEAIETKKIISYYESIGYKTIITSCNELVLNDLKEYLKDKVSVFTGQSGVGKSSLLNLIDPSLSIETNEISVALGRGKHTTRHVELLQVESGWVADTPGFGTIDFEGMEKIDLTQNFVEFFKNSSNCKYNGCLHINEPSCYVKELVNKNEILKSRYDNYLTFINDLGKDKKEYDSSPINSNSKRRRKK